LVFHSSTIAMMHGPINIICVTVVLLNHTVYSLDRAFYFKLLNNCYILCPNAANEVFCC